MSDDRESPERQGRVTPVRADAGEPPELSLRRRSFDASVMPEVIVDGLGRLSLVNSRARGMFRLTESDVGRPLLDLGISSRGYELLSIIEQAYAHRRSVVRKAELWRTPDGDEHWFDIVVTPLFEPNGAPTGANVSFMDVTRELLLQRELDDARVQLETAYHELHFTGEKLETTNEALQSTVEELETTNENFQSANDELQTMNEELQSTNETLQVVNDELRQRGESLNELNDFLDSMFRSLPSAVAVLNRELRVSVWNRQAEKLWGLRSAEAHDVHFVSLDIGLAVEQLAPAIRACLAGTIDSHDAELPAVDRRGRTLSCKISILPLIGRAANRPRGVIVLMNEQPATTPKGEGAAAASAAGKARA